MPQAAQACSNPESSPRAKVTQAPFRRVVLTAATNN